MNYITEQDYNFVRQYRPYVSSNR